MFVRHGIIISGEYVGWEAQVFDDTNGDTGGFYLILRSDDNEIFDYWFEKKEFLDNQLADFNVDWKS